VLGVHIAHPKFFEKPIATRIGPRSRQLKRWSGLGAVAKQRRGTLANCGRLGDLGSAAIARLPRKRTSRSAQASAPQSPEAHMVHTRRSVRSSQAVVDSELHETGAFDDKSPDIADSNNDDYTISENEQSTTSTTSSELDMSSNHSSSSEQLDDDASSSDKAPACKETRSAMGRSP